VTGTDGECTYQQTWRGLTQGGGGLLGGRNEAGDGVGTAVDALPSPAFGTAVVGVPGEDNGSATDNGIAQIYNPYYPDPLRGMPFVKRQTDLRVGAVLPTETVG
jgi:hypothetical protein